MNQLTVEIERLQKKTVEMNKAREKLDAECKLAESQRKMFEKQRNEEIVRLREIHEEEMRKLRVEKKIFEQYKQSVKEKPDRRERDEIERLNKQVHLIIYLIHTCIKKFFMIFMIFNFFFVRTKKSNQLRKNIEK